MIGAIHGVAIKDADVDALKKGMMTMPAHADAAEGLKMLKDAGFRMVILTIRLKSLAGRARWRTPTSTSISSCSSVSRRHAPTSRHRSSTAWWPGSSTCPARMLSGGDTCLGRDRRAERGQGGRPSHAAGQCHPADRKPPATESARPDLRALARKMIDFFSPRPQGCLRHSTHRKTARNASHDAGGMRLIAIKLPKRLLDLY
jgi:hypothetical protein